MPKLPGHLSPWLPSLPGEVCANCLETTCREIVETTPDDTQCSFRPGRRTTDQISLWQNFENSWEYAKDVYICFVKKACDR